MYARIHARSPLPPRLIDTNSVVYGLWAKGYVVSWLREGICAVALVSSLLGVGAWGALVVVRDAYQHRVSSSTFDNAAC